jgi:hypothetical protein
MTEVTKDKLAEIIDKIEASYEFMLAYAAQGRDRESTTTSSGDGFSIREFLSDMELGLKNIKVALADRIDSLNLQPGAIKSIEAFKDKLGEDADTALLAVQLVQSVPSISSQLVDNLNASAHLRCLLTDIFVMDEALKIHQHNQG